MPDVVKDARCDVVMTLPVCTVCELCKAKLLPMRITDTPTATPSTARDTMPGEGAHCGALTAEVGGDHLPELGR